MTSAFVVVVVVIVQQEQQRLSVSSSAKRFDSIATLSMAKKKIQS